RQRPHPVRVPARIQRVFIHERQAERAAHGGQQLQRGLLQGGIGRTVGQQRAQDVGVSGGRGRAAPGNQARIARTGGEFGGVDQVPVVPQRDAGAGRS